ncbi:hypothetical protein [Bartonella harrusi]|uniref:Phage related protein n=2 Tax=Bartonella harrusi TaxID=2961895 RepID=A0ABY5EVV2_9HYPH|nr:hypothetical protein [Bartonella harrusi]UTO29337.1 hypothetical protein NMK50_01410 [Bartonella harrusi]UTO29367.1 hypothetical protein NMK50_03715 [Bartonella harrusi]UTO29380.1 hypothetical protein NMK50_04540 [Bartonella harrusi]
MLDEEEDENDHDIDKNAEIFDDNEDEEEDEDNEDKRENIKAILEQERKRAQALTTLERQAKRLSVSFDAAKAIQNGMSIEKARQCVLTEASSQSASLKLSPYVPHADGESKAKIHTKWQSIWKVIK